VSIIESLLFVNFYLLFKFYIFGFDSIYFLHVFYLLLYDILIRIFQCFILIFKILNGVHNILCIVGHIAFLFAFGAAEVVILHVLALSSLDLL